MTVLMAAVDPRPGPFLRWGIFGLATGQQSVNLAATRRAWLQSAVSVMRLTSKPKESRRWAAIGVVGEFLWHPTVPRMDAIFDTVRMDAIWRSVDAAMLLNGRIFRHWAILSDGRNMQAWTAVILDIGKAIALDLDARASRPLLKHPVIRVLTDGFTNTQIHLLGYTTMNAIIVMQSVTRRISFIGNRSASENCSLRIWEAMV